MCASICARVVVQLFKHPCVLPLQSRVKACVHKSLLSGGERGELARKLCFLVALKAIFYHAACVCSTST